MRQIVDLMVNNYKFQNTSYLYNQIMNQYIKNVAKVSSINAIFRCMSSFQNFFLCYVPKSKSIFRKSSSIRFFIYSMFKLLLFK